MKVLICGMDGYIGWPLSMHLAARGHDVVGIDNFSRRWNVQRVGSWSATPIRSMDDRLELTDSRFTFFGIDLTVYRSVGRIMRVHKPDVIIHLGEIPSAPFSMIDVAHCNQTMYNNIIGTNNLLYAMHQYSPEAHLVKLGTMGEYGTPNVDIPEGFFDVEYNGRKDRLPFPRQAGSWYHQTKVHDSHNIMFACKIWGLRSTDIMQGVVHGIDTPQMQDERLITRFDFDEIWGTSLNRYCAQAVIGHLITPYGIGGQTRGYIALRDSIQCLTIAAENPPDEGEYRVFNQYDECYTVNELAVHVQNVSRKIGLDSEILNIRNPRVEAEKHYYNPTHESLSKLGFKPQHTLDQELEITLRKLVKYKDRIKAKKEKITPTVFWRA